MEINWFTVIAQLLNFLILVWLLKRFLYQPILKAIDERERKIASRLEDAALSKAEAQKDKELFRKKNEEFEKERVAKMNMVHEKMAIEKERLFEEVRVESTALRSKFEDSFKQHEQEVKDKLKQKTKSTVFAIAGKTLSDLANANLEEQVIQVFITKIRQLGEAEKVKFTNALTNNQSPVTIRTAFELTPNSKQALEKVIEEIADKPIQFDHELDEELLSGIEMKTGSYQLAWTIESYLDSLNSDSFIIQN